ncbi:probable plastid-lipid-associated protein 10, chloroplastic [Daucus carota subsp. sativus]|uniref:probable plastid-lipid-associated protein 10, chloroplastic n=1 Tax=Daucus carota subsp. sativus TaxID=79200 RepID=UPI0007EF85B9|nr:PREDICTED: probable plastid-lipid-associated protein 10, chloroplastic [Daucus carota subsp. sativus]
MRTCPSSWLDLPPLLYGTIRRGANLLHLPTSSSTIRPKSSTSFSKLIHHKPTILNSSSSTNEVEVKVEVDTETRKHNLLKAIQDTQRGISATPLQRSCIEEALVSLEALDAALPLDLDLLNGNWRLQYTSAPDVLILFESANRLPFFQVGQIYQSFECQAESKGGYVCNVVRWSIPKLLEEEEGATLLVSAKFSVVSSRNIFLQFEEITIKDIYISEEVQALIAPAILPRTFFSLQILQFIRTFEAQYPVENPGRQSVGGLYYLSYLDNNILLGRAVGGGGVFVFTRAPTLV